MLTTDTALPELRRRLAVAGFDEARPDLSMLWPALKDWAALPVESMDPARDADMLLFECSLDLRPPGKYSPGAAFIVGFTRQFSFEDEDGEYAGMEHVCVELRYAINDDFRGITRMSSNEFGTADQFWGSGGERAGDWAGRVEASRSYQVALRHQATEVELFHTPV